MTRARQALIACLFGITAHSASSEPPGTLPGLEAFVDGTVEAMMTDHPALPGVTISVVHEGEVVLLKGYGFADLESRTPVDPSRSLFRIGSITKTFTGLAVMQMVERGELDLDADINTYLEAFKIPEAFGSPITLRHLLNHRAGFEDGLAGHLFAREPSEAMHMSDYLPLHMTERVRPPAQSSTYTNYGIALAGYIVEVVSGQDFATYLDEHIFQPLNMHHTTIREPLGAGHPQTMQPALEALLATGYAKGANGKPVAKPQDLILQVAPAGAISSTAADMARYMIARLDGDRYEGGRLVSPEMTEYMQRRPFNDRPLILDMGYAMAEGSLDGYQYRWHNGGGSTFFSDMSMFPDLGMGIFISTNSSDGGAKLAARVPQLIFEKYFPTRLETNAPLPPADFVSRGQVYSGQYLATRRSYTKLEKVIALPQVFDVSVDDEGYLVVSGGGQTRRYAEIEDGVFQTADTIKEGRNRYGYLYFYDNDDGLPVRFSVSTTDPVRISFIESPSFFYLALGLAFLLSTTFLLSGWRRIGRGLDHTTAEKWASRLGILGAVTVYAAVTGLGLFITLIAGGDLDPIIFDWPPAPLRVAVVSATVVPIIAIAMLLLWGRAWHDKGWDSLRKLHYLAFCLTLVTATIAFSEWNMIGFRY